MSIWQGGRIFLPVCTVKLEEMKFMLFSLIGVYGVALIGLVVLVFLAVKTILVGDERRKIHTYVIGYILLIILARIILLSGFSNPSRIDISPLGQLAAYKMCDLNELIAKVARLEAIDSVEQFNSQKWEGDVGREWACWYKMYNWDIPASINVYFWIYDSSENARKSFNWEKKNKKERKKIIKISENIDVMLCNSIMYRSTDTFLAYSSQRDISTYVRIGNIVLDYSEHLSEPREIGVLTSKNIELICQVLTE